ncbi:uncharacterized protein LOC110246159 [Exaiptasia diaphana]|uniref:Uncharacterized protein n=1 Tax=Exaiptasia diaphana TaxID=2652724 RepID=A0A913XRL8_EXADI|nr:uncharacterized protein LOC110246159 [Exaiptasia diaphana]
MAQREQHHVSPYKDGLDKLVDSLAFLEHNVSARKELLGISPAGPEGSVYHLTVKGFSETVSSLETHVQALELIGMGNIVEQLNLSAFVNESRKEHGFAKHKQAGQYRHPTKEQYCKSKGRHEIELIKKTCQLPHAYHTNNYTAYQPTHKSPLSSIETVQLYRQWSDKLNSCTSEVGNKNDLKVARMFNTLTKAKPSQNVRDLYRYKCGYGPCVMFQKDALFQDETYNHHYPAFHQLMTDLEVQRNTTNNERIVCNDYLLLPGDIAAVNPGSNEGIPSADKWWLLQINKAHPAGRTGSGCHVFGFWLNEEILHEEGRRFHLLTPSVKVYYGSIIKDPESKLPIVVPVEELNAGWNTNSVSYAFSDEYCHKLDVLAERFRKDLDLVDETPDTHTDSGSDTDGDPDELQHEVELSALNARRRRTITNADGNVVQSYRDLCLPRTRRTKQRLEALTTVDNFSGAERNNPEF